MSNFLELIIFPYQQSTTKYWIAMIAGQSEQFSGFWEKLLTFHWNLKAKIISLISTCPWEKRNHV